MRYGAEHECLRRMCGKEDGYIRIARYDRARLDIRNYDQSVLRKGGKWLLNKDPGNLLTVGAKIKSCQRYGIECRFLVVVKSPWAWKADVFNCTGTCRTQIIDNWCRCHSMFAANSSPRNTRLIYFEDLIYESTFRAIENWLRLSPPVGISFQNTLSNPERRLIQHNDIINERVLRFDLRYMQNKCQKPSSRDVDVDNVMRRLRAFQLLPNISRSVQLEYNTGFFLRSVSYWSGVFSTTTLTRLKKNENHTY
uniref:Sulfotransferase domain-containing protein n=1 Tax=Aureoumbra lagunensis TaxID=44058 RepID=A0A7S3JTT2_9STRA